MTDRTDIQKHETQDIQRVERTRPGRTYIPNVDIVEQAHELLVMADMPGVKADDLDIQYEHGELTIHGVVHPRQADGQTNYTLCEYGVGDFHRVFQVGESIDPTKIEAEISDGVLTLHLPKAESAKPRRIAVKAK